MKIKSLLFGSLLAATAVASADTFTYNINVSNVQTNGEFGEAGNYSATFDLGAAFAGYSNFVVTGVGFDANFTANSPSWLSEITFAFTNTGISTGIFSSPGFADDNSGTAAYNSGGIEDLVGLGLDFALDADNVLYMEIFEGFDDPEVSIDGVVNSAAYTIQVEAQPVPEPATLAALGVGAAALLRRRKNKKA